MKPNIFNASRSFRTKRQSRSSTDSTESEHATYRGKRGTTAGSSAAVNLGVPNTPIAFSGRHQWSSDVERRPVIEGEISWGVLAAFGAALASTGLLLALASTGGIYLD